jgi:hypothetical protein
VNTKIIFMIFSAAMIVPLLTGAIAVFTAGRKKKRDKGSTALLFHSITSCRNTHLSHFPPDKFDRLIDRIAVQGFTTSTLNEAASDASTSARAKFVITFDDGFESFFTHALPVLEAYGIKATIFPIAGFMGKMSCWDVLPRQPHMTKAQLREVSDSGHEIGSHTMTHSNLTFLDEKDVYRELFESKRTLEDLVGKPITSLSFPFGSWNARIWNKAREIGYLQATCYRHHGRIIKGLVPVRGVYSFDTIDDVIEKTISTAAFSNAIARSRIMCHFAKGTPLWNFRKNYALLR